MSVGLFLFGLLLGILLGWRWLGEKHAGAPPAQDLSVWRERAAAAEARVRDLEAAQDTGDTRVTALEEERRTLAERVRTLEEELARSRAAPTAKPSPSQAPMATTNAPDDLTRIRGIGPKLAQKLGSMGITRFSQLAGLSREEIARIDAAIDFPGRIARERWVEQARELAGAGRSGTQA
jgi:predicted flap endonuclease-1-like 5' DNA nuclease